MKTLLKVVSSNPRTPSPRRWWRSASRKQSGVRAVLVVVVAGATMDRA
jgi:hypothetical protein